MIAFATLTPDSPRRDLWMRVFGATRIRLESTESYVTTLPGDPTPRRCYRAVVGSLAGGDMDELFAHAKAAPGPWEINTDLALGRHGIPVLAGPDLIVTLESRFAV